jgi:energy-coupling factor transporter ATP-binding protein EcfA2
MTTARKNRYLPPQDMWEVNANLDFNEPLENDDPRYVDTEKGRGQFNFKGLLTTLGVDTKQLKLRSPKDKSYNLFCGHRGCGKSTELRRLSRYLHGNNLFFVIFLDSVADLDTHNLEYSDLLLALANKLLVQLKENDITINNVFLEDLNQWFSEKILDSEKLKDFSMEVETGAEARGGIPFLAKLSAKLTGKIKTGATYKEEIRRVVKNSFSEFAAAFNQLIDATENVLKEKNKAGKLIFIIDGTDRLNTEDSHRLFIKDTYQLQQIAANFIYCAPIHLLYEGNQVQQGFSQFILPMIKIAHEKSAQKHEDGYEVLREIIFKRADKKLFASKELVDVLIENSGGNPRDLLKLLSYALQESNMEIFTGENIKEAVHKLSMDYRMFLNTEDYQVLYKIDHAEIVDENSEQIRSLLYNLAILQYNNYWWASHPVIRHLDGYKKAGRPVIIKSSMVRGTE